jgi:hypothetical protein
MKKKNENGVMASMKIINVSIMKINENENIS